MAGLIRLALDFGSGEQPPPSPPPPPTPPGNPTVRGLVADASSLVKLVRATPWAMWPEGSLERADADLETALQLLPTDPGQPPPPPPPPQPKTLSGIYGTYPEHGLAKDLYGGRTEAEVMWGPHHGLPIRAPADGRVELYAIGTPLAVRMLGLETTGTEAWNALFTDWVCRVNPLQTMFVAVWWPAAAYGIGGQHIGHLHYGHVRQDVKTGSVKKDEQFATSWDSGIRWEPGIATRAAHTHCCAGVGNQLSPNGDLDGRLAVLAQGWSPVTDVGFVPGPREYSTGQYCAGRKRSDFTAAKQPIPPMPE